jgi:hypothetical protein
MPRETTIARQPANQSVSLGATAVFRVTTTSTNPITYQWQHNDRGIDLATNASLTLTNVQLPDAGPYTAAVSDVNGTNVSNPAMLDMDPTFTKITTGAIVTDKAHWHCAAWTTRRSWTRCASSGRKASCRS